MEIQIKHPREQEIFIGHDKAEGWLLNAAREGKFPHSLIISGPKGVGKATLFYRLARFIAVHGMESNASSLSLDSKHPVFQKIAKGLFTDLWVVGDSPENENTGDITIDDVRALSHFMSHTPAESFYRIAVIDDADKMNRNAANALLKILEEPPKHALIVLISHAPGRLLPTIRSRCQHIRLTQLSDEQMQEFFENSDTASGYSNIISGFAEGSPGNALRLMTQDIESSYIELLHYLASFPKSSQKMKYQLAEKYTATDQDEAWESLCMCLLDVIARSVKASAFGMSESLCFANDNAALEEKKVLQFFARHYSIDRLSALWEKLSLTLNDGKRFNMSRRQQFMQLTHLLEAA